MAVKTSTLADTLEREAALVGALRNGEDAAYEELVRTETGRLLQIARRYVDEDGARDAVQETFVKAFRAIGDFDGKSRLATWLHRILVNTCLMQIRRSSRKPEESIDTLLPTFHPNGKRVHLRPSWIASGDEIAKRAETRQILAYALARIPEAYREPLVLYELEGIAADEIAERLGLSANAVRIRLHRARQALREILDTSFDQGGRDAKRDDVS